MKTLQERHLECVGLLVERVMAGERHLARLIRSTVDYYGLGWDEVAAHCGATVDLVFWWEHENIQASAKAMAETRPELLEGFQTYNARHFSPAEAA